MAISTIILSVFIFVAIYFQVFLLITYLENKKGFSRDLKNKKAELRSAPSVTIIVPCLNEEKTVAKTTQSLLQLDYQKDKLFVFVIDDGSTDKTAEAVKPFLSDPRVKYFYKENGGKHTALNLGIEKAETELVGCLDADSFVSKHSLLAIIDEFANPEIMAVTPAIKIHESKTIIQYIQETEYTLSLILRKLLASINAQYVAPGPFSIYRRSIFNIVGEFKLAHNTEDMEMAMRLQMHRYKIGNAFNAEVYTVAPSTFRSLLRQRTRWTYGFIRNALDYRFMIFRKKYGNIGMFSIPTSFISITAVLYFAFYLTRNSIQFIGEKFTYFTTVGFSTIFEPKLSWFFINTEAVMLLIYFSLMIFMAFLSLSVYHVRGGFLFKKSDLYYVLLYGFIAPLWMIRTISQLVLWRTVKWK